MSWLIILRYILSKNYADPLTALELLKYYLTLAMSSNEIAYYVVLGNYATNDSIFYVFELHRRILPRIPPMILL